MRFSFCEFQSQDNLQFGNILPYQFGFQSYNLVLFRWNTNSKCALRSLVWQSKLYSTVGKIPYSFSYRILLSCSLLRISTISRIRRTPTRLSLTVACCIGIQLWSNHSFFLAIKDAHLSFLLSLILQFYNCGLKRHRLWLIQREVWKSLFYKLLSPLGIQIGCLTVEPLGEWLEVKPVENRYKGF